MIAFPCLGSITVEECASPFRREDAIGRTVVENGVGIFRGGNPAKDFEGFEVEHDHRLIVAGGGETAS